EPAPAPEPAPNHGVAIIVNGVSEGDVATGATLTEGDHTTTVVTIDKQKLSEKLEREGEGAVVAIPVQTGADRVVGELTGDMVKDMQMKQATLEVKTEAAAYTLPVRRLLIESISSQLGENVDLAKVAVRVQIKKPANDTVKVVENAAKKGTFVIVAPPVEFSVTVAYDGKSVEVSKFDAYVERTVAIPDGIDPNRITTGVVVDADGTVRHVPTRVVVIDGRYFARINSLTNSTYSVVWHPLEFGDVANHWAKLYVNEMGSRMVVAGVGDNRFDPDRDVTRAEFATIIVRALGIKPAAARAAFQDVRASDWFAGYVAAATEYGILLGYEDGTFRAGKSITREEAMTMIARAMKVAGMQTSIAPSDAQATLAQFADAASFASWSSANAAVAVQHGVIVGSGGLARPTDNISRAETATIIMRMLQKAGLI
ncbi:MAG TPA: S-layer homology domain-containing protein, partial [Symbiobacteriaceae bacterium]|nr:S-layer homology domain-containing protein [Symbiobacteriaceae bacterium]